MQPPPFFSHIICEDSALRSLVRVGRRNKAPVPGVDKLQKVSACLCPRFPEPQEHARCVCLRALCLLTWTGLPPGGSALSLLWVGTLGLLELMSTGELMCSAGRSAGACTMRFSVLRAVVSENCRRLFRRGSGALGKGAGTAALALGDAVPWGCGDQWPLVACRSC